MNISARTSGFAVRRRNAGGVHRKAILTLQYKANCSKPRLAKSNDPGYGKSWTSPEEITHEDEEAFRSWVEAGMARGGGKQKLAVTPLEMATLSSARMSERRSKSASEEEATAEIRR